MYEASGSAFDYANVIYAVLTECEHRRRSFSDDEAAAGLRECAEEILSKIGRSFLEGGGPKGYWADLEKEVRHTVMPQYIPSAIEQNQLERSGWGVWRKGDLSARIVFTLIALVVALAVIALPLMPQIERIFALVVAAGGWFYPDLKQVMHERQHARRLNRLVAAGAVFQRNRARYLTNEDLEVDLGDNQVTMTEEPVATDEREQRRRPPAETIRTK